MMHAHAGWLARGMVGMRDGACGRGLLGMGCFLLLGWLTEAESMVVRMASRVMHWKKRAPCRAGWPGYFSLLGVLTERQRMGTKMAVLRTGRQVTCSAHM
eukprot:353366-Chlamydomonas_euryale.AAC.1